MNPRQLFKRRPPKRAAESFRGGFALVAVLSVLLICALLIILLLDRASTSLQSASTYRRTEAAKTLADMAVSRVQAQILDATTLDQRADTPLSGRSTWASQPGAIRVFGPTGSLSRIFKLYSSDEMQTTSANLAADIPDQWFNSPSLYTDLNEPIKLDNADEQYPILNPDVAALMAGAIGIEDGFSISGAPVDPGTSNPAPMPVRWIYVLQDGTHCQLGDSRINRDTNPIIGRIAFWTDDETAKVNINTASPASADSFWDVPRVGGNGEYNLFAMKQPAQNEYHRYPGHPAMVSLRPILGNLTADKATFFRFSPYYRWGGSMDGTVAIDATRIPLLTNKEDRAYATVDEILFRSDAPQLAQPTAVQVDALRFFLTASSRAPELNLFGQPRVSIWPVHQVNNPTRRTPFDQLIAFCSTIGGKEYFFTREQPLHPTHDYLDIPRNRFLYGYLQDFTAVGIPGFSGTATFLDKYGNDRDQILTEIFDYIRIVNLNETYKGRDPNFKSYTRDWAITRFNDAATVVGTTGDYSEDGPTAGAGLVVPIEIGDTRGMGRFPVLAEAGLWFIRHLKGAGKGKNNVHSETNPKQLEAFLMLETITPAFGYMPWCGKSIQYEIVSSDVKVRTSSGDHNLFSPSITRNIYWPPVVLRGRSPGGYDGFAYTAGVDRSDVAGISTTHYQLVSNPIDCDEETGTFSILGGNIILNVRSEGIVLQTLTLHFPSSGEISLPAEDTHWNSIIAGARPWWGSRFQGSHGPVEGDVVHSLETATGDVRITAAWKNVPADFFQKHEVYGTDVPFAHGFRTLNVERTNLGVGATTGSYVDLPTAASTAVTEQGRTNMSTRLPKISSSIHSLRPTWSGDFDNGFGSFLDGPFINKPDEGMMYRDLTADYGDGRPYYDIIWSLADGLFSPLRQIPSAVMFGSLPSGAKARIPWRTLLFCPNPADPSHYGFEEPPDHLLLDLFRMPVVEPLAISGPASTDGKINMNYAIAPFDNYIKRKSAWYALLETLKITSIPDSQSTTYKNTRSQNLSSALFRKRVDIPKTLSQFDARFASNDIFRSATEVCSLFLVPEGSTLDSVKNLESGYWSTHRLTGDNTRERPYAELYPKLTTQSNTYRVHFRVQALPPSGELPAGKDDFVPLAEYRGSRLIERYLDPTNPRFAPGNPDYVDPDTDNLNELYQFRVLEARQFNP